MRLHRNNSINLPTIPQSVKINTLNSLAGLVHLTNLLAHPNSESPTDKLIFTPLQFSQCLSFFSKPFMPCVLFVLSFTAINTLCILVVPVSDVVLPDVIAGKFQPILLCCSFVRCDCVCEGPGDHHSVCHS